MATERHLAEDQLRQSEELFRLFVESVKDYAIFMLDADGNVASWNAGARRIKGYEAQEIIGRHFSTFYSADDVRARKPDVELEIAKRDGRVEDEGWRVRKDGTRFWANVVITAVHDKSGVLRGFTKVTRDITERKQAEETQRSYIAAREANRAKDEFLMTLSHELRTPLTAILGWAKLLHTMSPADEMFREAVTAIARSAELQAQLIDDVLDVSRIVSGKLSLNRKNVDVERILRNSVEAVRATAEARSLKLTMSLPTGLGMLFVDPTRIQQVIWNLLTNALKFTRPGGSVHVSAARTSEQVQISVTDTGQGIDPHFLPHVFEPFRQAESPRTRVHGGLGLGLSIVRYLVEAHGGTVSAESAGRDQGATFTVALPLTVPAMDSGRERTIHHVPDDPKAIDPRRLKDVRILVVDDDRENRVLVRTVLRQAGAETTIVDSARAALEEFDSGRPDLVLTDIAMPDVDGYELARTLRRREGGKDVILVALSAFPEISVGATAEQSGFDKFMPKPIDPFDLVEAIAELLGR